MLVLRKRALAEVSARELIPPGELDKPKIIDGLAVKKRGTRTGETKGKIQAQNYMESPKESSDKTDASIKQILINVEYGNATSGIFRFTAPGDSGSVVMTETGGKVVALLWGSVAKYPLAPANENLIVIKGVATNIHDVMKAMDITIEAATQFGALLPHSASAESAVAAAFGPLRPQPIARSMLDRARRDIEQTLHGRAYTELIRRHHNEVWRLVRENRRVGATWKHYGGQALVQLILNSVARPDEPIPSTIGGRSVDQSTARIAAMLRRYGSAALASDVGAYERGIVGLCGCTYNQLLARLRGGEPVLD